MPRAGIGYEDVKKAATALLAKGINPSIQRVRAELGTGSNSTIGQHLKHWQQELTMAPKATLPPSVPETVMAALELFWQQAVEQAEAGYQQHREEAMRTVAAAQQSRDEALAGIDQARQEGTALAHQLSHAQATIRKQHDSFQQERERRMLAEAAIQAAEQQAIQAAEATEQIRLQTAARIQQAEEALQQAHQQTRERLAEARQQLDYERERGQANEVRLMQVIDQIRTEHAAERQRLEAARTVWKANKAALQRQIESLQQDIATLRLLSLSAEQRAHVLDAELTHARTTLKELQGRHLDAVRDVESLRGEIKLAVIREQRLEVELQDCRKAMQAKQSSPPPPQGQSPGGPNNS